MNFLGMSIAFFVGIWIDTINYRISIIFIKKKPDVLAYANIVHQAVAIIFLLIVYFAGPLTPFDRFYLLIGAVIGITVMIVFTTVKLLKITSSAKPEKKEIQKSDNKEDTKNGGKI